MRIHNREAPSLFRALEKQEDSVKQIAISRDGKILASGDQSGWLSLWSVESGKRLRHVRVTQAYVGDLVFTPSGALWMTDGLGRIHALQSPLRSSSRVMGPSNVAHQRLSYSHRLKRVLTGGSTGEIRFYGPQGRDTRTIEAGSWVSALAVDQSGRYLAVGHGDGQVTIWDLDTRRLIAREKIHQKQIFGIRWFPGKAARVCSGSADGTFRTLRLDRIPKKTSGS